MTRARLLAPFWGATLAFAVLLLSGCSGAGVAPGALTNAPLQELATDQMTALQLLRGWLGVTYPPPARRGPYALVLHRETTGAVTHVWGTDSYRQVFDYLTRDDGSGRGTWYTPAGLAVSGSWGPQEKKTLDDLRRRYTQHLAHQVGDLAMDWRAVTIQPPEGQTGMAVVHQEGTLSLADGRRLQFTFYRDAVDTDVLTLSLPAEGITLRVAVPVAFVTNNGWLPLLHSEARGQMQVGGRSLGLTLSGIRQSWRALTVRRADGLTGSFSLEGKLAGSGRFEQDGVVSGVMEWGDDLVGHLALTNQQQEDVLPAAAARDLAVEQWIASRAELGPGPAL